MKHIERLPRMYNSKTVSCIGMYKCASNQPSVDFATRVMMLINGSKIKFEIIC